LAGSRLFFPGARPRGPGGPVFSGNRGVSRGGVNNHLGGGNKIFCFPTTVRGAGPGNRVLLPGGHQGGGRGTEKKGRVCLSPGPVRGRVSPPGVRGPRRPSQRGEIFPDSSPIREEGHFVPGVVRRKLSGPFFLLHVFSAGRGWGNKGGGGAAPVWDFFPGAGFFFSIGGAPRGAPPSFTQGKGGKKPKKKRGGWTLKFRARGFGGPG